MAASLSPSPKPMSKAYAHGSQWAQRPFPTQVVFPVPCWLVTMSKGLAQPLMSSSDPFYAFRDGVSSLLDDVETAVMRWKSMFESVNTAEDSSFVAYHEEVQGKIGSADKTLTTFEAAVTNIEKNRAKFPHVDDQELASRKESVLQLKERLAAARNTVSGKKAQGKMDQDRKSMLTARADRDRAVASPSKYEVANEGFIGDQKARQAMLHKEQDEHLEDISSSLHRLNEVAVAINVEVDEQNKMLGDMERDVDDVQGRMDNVLKTIGKFLQTKSNCQTWTIILLILILIGVGIAAVT